jgi:outer membrane protein TolC
MRIQKRQFGLGTLVFSILFTFSPSAFSQSLPLRDYLNQVQVDNDNYVASSRRTKALELRGDEWKLFARPNLIAGAEDYKDKRLTNNPQFQGSQTNMKTYYLGLHQTTNFGLDATLTYKYIQTNIIGAGSNFIPQPNFVVATPILELNQSLWKNFAGRQTEAKREGQAAAVRAERLSEEFNLIKMTSDAEVVYWRLVLARKLVVASKGNLERAERISSWFTKRSRMELTDRSDSLQGQAVLASRKIEMQAALDEERAAARAFNLMRGSTEEVVTEKLDELKYDQIVKLEPPDVTSTRKDLQAAQQSAIADRAKAKEAEENAKPDVSAYANLSLNGRAPSGSTSMDQSFSNKYPMTVIGVRLNVPLSLGIASDTRQGYRLQAETSEVIVQRKTYELSRNLLELTRLFEAAKKRLALAVELESAQQSKVNFERDRRGRGRSTTYQVIQFEQDYAAAQVTRINLESEILNIYAQLKTFGGSK